MNLQDIPPHCCNSKKQLFENWTLSNNQVFFYNFWIYGCKMTPLTYHSKPYKIHSFYYTSMIILQFKEIRKWLMIIPHIIKIAQNIRLASRGFIIQNMNKYGFHRIMTYNISWYEFANGLRLNIDYKRFIFSVDVKCETFLLKNPIS